MAIRETPDDSRLYVNLGRVYEEQHQFGRAEHTWRRAVSIDPGDHRAWNLLGNAARRQDRYDDAIACYKKAIAAEPDFAEAHWNLAVCYRAIGMVPLASDHYRRYMTLSSPADAYDRKAAEAFLSAAGDQ
jgi:tetratricopeptide (TPR) repeat protein